MALCTFGKTWGEKHILTLFPEFIKAAKENVSSLYPVEHTYIVKLRQIFLNIIISS